MSSNWLQIVVVFWIIPRSDGYKHILLLLFVLLYICILSIDKRCVMSLKKLIKYTLYSLRKTSTS